MKKISTIKQRKYEEVQNKNFDFFIVASGFETRAAFQAKQYKGMANSKIALGFKNEPSHPNRVTNDNFYRENGFESILMESEVTNDLMIKNIVSRISEAAKGKENVDVYIDYSSMTKNWYAYLLYAFQYLSQNITVTLGYSHSKYVPFNGTSLLNRIVKPLIGYCNLSVPSKPTALIIGIGNEPNRIYGLTEYFDAVPFLFYSDNSYNPDYSTEIEILNKDLLNDTKAENIFRFPIYDLKYTYYLLNNLCNVLTEKYRVVIAPCGPKPFALLSMINSLMYENLIEVWRISPGDSLPRDDKEPTGLISVIELNYI